MLLDLQWLYGMPRIDTEVESIHPHLLETFALHQRCSYKCGQMMHLSGLLLCDTRSQVEKQPNHLSASCHLEVSDYPVRFLK